MTIQEPVRRAPYAPPSAVTDLVARYRDQGLGSPIDASVLERAGVSASLIPRTLQALQLLGLIDDSGSPTPAFEQVRIAPSSEYKQVLAEVVRGAYADIFQYTDPSRDEYEKVEDAFRTYQPAGQRSRMVTLFLGLCEAAGIVTEAPKKKRASSKRRASAAPKQRSTPTSRKAKPNIEPEHLGRKESGSSARGGFAQATGQIPDGFARQDIPTLKGAYIQYPVAMSSKDLALFEAALTFVKAVTSSSEGGSE